MRNRFAEVLENLMKKDDRIVLLYGDIGNRLFDSIKLNFPSRVLNCGVAEANMVSVAAGLQSMGLKPVVYTISSFLYLKGLEQIKLDACYPKRSIVLVGTGGGFSYAGLGVTHHSLEDFAVLGSLPEIALFSPADRHELDVVLTEALDHGGPSWIRLGKKGEPEVHHNLTKASGEWPLAPQLAFPKVARSEGEKIIVFSTGLLVHESVSAGALLSQRGFPVEVWSVPQLKPFPASVCREIVGSSEHVFTVEEHVPLGGLRSMVMECLGQQSIAFVHSINSGDSFHSRSGSMSFARERQGLSSEAIASQIGERIGNS